MATPLVYENSKGEKVAYYDLGYTGNGNRRMMINFLSIADSYSEALQIARRCGVTSPRKYRAKWYGGGITFIKSNLRDDLERLTVRQGND